MDSALNIDPDQAKHAEQAKPDIYVSPPVEFLFQESLLCTSIPLGRNVLTRISLHGLYRLIWIDTLRRIHNVGFLVRRLICVRFYLRTVRSLIMCFSSFFGCGGFQKNNSVLKVLLDMGNLFKYNYGY